MRMSRKEFIRLTGLASLGLVSGCGGGPNGLIDGPPVEPTGLLAEYSNYLNLVGDIHSHSNLSDGDEAPDFAARYARDVAKLDFYALTDHAEWLLDKGGPGIPYYRTIPGKYDDPGKFCMLFAWEWTSIRFGHRIIYSLDNQVPIRSSLRPATKDLYDFWDSLNGYDIICVPHHPMIPTTYKWWDFENPEIEFLVEFYSKWGSSLYYDNPRPIHNQKADYGIYEALRNGRHYGMIASSDTHLSRTGCSLMECRPPILNYRQPGYIGVWATAHTREAIFDALKNRRCYGCAGTRVNLQFTVNRAVMGASINSSEAPEIAFRVSSGVSITRVAIMKITNLSIDNIMVYAPAALESDGIYTDATFTSDCSYMLRVDLANGDFAICSPVVVKKVT